MADNGTQSNIDDLVKELSRPQGVPPKSNEPVSTLTPPKPMAPPASTKPIMPSSTMPKPPVMPPKPSTSVPAAPSAPKAYDSSIRTMSDDLSHLKSGQKPEGISVPRTVQSAPAPKTSTPPLAVPKPPVMPPPPPTKSHLPGLPTTPKASTMPPLPPKPAMPPSPKAPAMTAPKMPTPPPTQPPKDKGQDLYTPQNGASSGGINRSIIFISIAVVAVIIAVAYWFFFIRQPSTPVAQETPTETVTPTSTPLSTVQSIFPGQAGTIVLPASGNPASAFAAALSTQTIAPGSFGVLNVQNSIASGSAQTLDPFSLMDRFLVSYPATLKTNGSSSDSAILAFGQQESFDSKGKPVTGQAVSPRLVLVAQVASSSMTALQAWEPNMTSSLAGLMGINQAKAASKTFQASTYNGVQVRFDNFSYPDHSIDYTVLPRNGNYYLILAGSREAMFATIDAFKTSGQ